MEDYTEKEIYARRPLTKTFKLGASDDELFEKVWKFRNVAGSFLAVNMLAFGIIEMLFMTTFIDFHVEH